MLKEKILLKNDCSYPFEDISIYENLMTIIFSDDISINDLLLDMSNFDDIKILTRGDSVCAEYKDFNTVYKQNDHTLILSNDKTVYTEPEPLEPIVEPELTLDEVKTRKITELSSACSQLIAKGVTMDIDGNEESFSYKDVDQTNIKDAFELAQQTQMDVPYHADNQGCKLYTIEQITKLYIKEKLNLTHHTTYFNQLKMFVLSMDDSDSVKAVKYGQDLTGKYLEGYNMIMNQATLIIQKLVERGVDNGNEISA